MKTIQLIQGQVALVDDEDFERLNQWKWHCLKRGKTFYAARSISLGEKQKRYWMHREILNTFSGFEIDHKNKNGLDNRKENLRICTTAENQWNSNRRIDNTSGFKGVHWMNGKFYKGKQYTGKWYARIRFNGQRIYLGLFLNKIDAAKAYDRKAQELFGEFACLNFEAQHESVG